MTARQPTSRRGPRIARALLSLLYGVAGIAHIASPAGFLLITPGWVPYPKFVILATGICEIAGVFGLQIAFLRRAAGIGLALYAVCVFPANIHHALYGLPPGYPRLGPWYHVPRLAFQPVLVWAALYAGGTGRPRKRAAAAR